MISKSRIIALGAFLPKKILTNSDLEKKVDTSDEWIVSRTGIKERRIAGDEEHASHLGALAAIDAIDSIGFNKDKIELIICATMTPDYLTPSTAALIQNQIGLKNAAAYDCQAACTGFIFALSQAKAFIESGIYKTVLVVATEKMSSFIDYEDRNTCVLFGDGAAAALISGEGPGLLIEGIALGTDGALSHLIIIPAGGSRSPSHGKREKGDSFLKMEGREVFKHAVRRMGSSIDICLKNAKLTHADISWLIPHQANKRIIDAIASHLSISEEKVFYTLQKYGNTSGSSVGIALTELMREKEIKTGEHLQLVAFGAGLTWGGAVLKKVNS